MSKRYLAGLQALCEIQTRVRSLHPALQTLQPVAVAEGDRFSVYDVAADGSYALALEAPTPMPIPTGVRAAFNLESYANRMVCVVTGEIFDEPGGNITLLHEFVHCYQANTCEMALKQSLAVARQAMEKGDFMWELEYPFPYQLFTFVETYSALFAADDSGDDAALLAARQALHANLPNDALEYLRWQEWKEGFARWLENRMRRQLGMAENHYGRQQPFNRIAFYEGGAVWIDWLERQDAAVPLDIEALFYRMAQAT
jgi:hypothetical protein